MILMEDQVTDTMFSGIKRLIWSKMSRFIQGVSIVTNQLSQGELSCLWENNKDIMMLFLMGEMFSNRLEQIILNNQAIMVHPSKLGSAASKTNYQQ